MKLTYIFGDLLVYGEKFPIAHCISGDLVLGKGIAKKIDNKFKVRRELGFMGIKRMDVGMCIKTNDIYNLVTKNRYNDKPIYTDLFRALTDMKMQLKGAGITKIYMPTIGCGLDRLSWHTVYGLICHVFSNTQIDIVIILPDKDACIKHDISVYEVE